MNHDLTTKKQLIVKKQRLAMTEPCKTDSNEFTRKWSTTNSPGKITTLPIDSPLIHHGSLVNPGRFYLEKSVNQPSTIFSIIDSPLILPFFQLILLPTTVPLHPPRQDLHGLCSESLAQLMHLAPSVRYEAPGGTPVGGAGNGGWWVGWWWPQDVLGMNCGC